MTSSVAWTKHEQKQKQTKKPSDTNAETSRAQRMTSARKAVNEAGTNAFSRNTPPKVTAPVVSTPKATKTNFGGREDESLRVARENEEARRAGVRKQKEEKALIPQYVPQDADEIRVLTQGWIAARPAFHVSEWNIEMVNRAVFYLISKGMGSWNFVTLDAAFQHLSEHQHLEAPSRVRGSLPPVEFVVAGPEAETAAADVVQRSASPEEIAALKKVPFEQLQQATRLQFKKRGA
jgi:hypothetical protein